MDMDAGCGGDVQYNMEAPDLERVGKAMRIKRRQRCRVTEASYFGFDFERKRSSAEADPANIFYSKKTGSGGE